MINYNFNETQIIGLIQAIFTFSICFAIVIIIIFNYYRNKILILTKNK